MKVLPMESSTYSLNTVQREGQFGIDGVTFGQINKQEFQQKDSTPRMEDFTLL